MDFHIKRTPIDKVSILLLKNGIIAEVVMNSQMSPLICKVAAVVRNQEERSVANDLERFRT